MFVSPMPEARLRTRASGDFQRHGSGSSSSSSSRQHPQEQQPQQQPWQQQPWQQQQQQQQSEQEKKDKAWWSTALLRVSDCLAAAAQCARQRLGPAGLRASAVKSCSGARPLPGSRAARAAVACGVVYKPAATARAARRGGAPRVPRGETRRDRALARRRRRRRLAALASSLGPGLAGSL
jgi:hypothetical protein